MVIAVRWSNELDIHTQVQALLIDLEADMRSVGLWEEREPEPEAFASEQPFFIDTMALNQWLQFVLIPRFRQIAVDREPLPTNCQIAPIAEEFFSAVGASSRSLIGTIQELDSLLASRDS